MIKISLCVRPPARHDPWQKSRLTDPMVIWWPRSPHGTPSCCDADAGADSSGMGEHLENGKRSPSSSAKIARRGALTSMMHKPQDRLISNSTLYYVFLDSVFAKTMIFDQYVPASRSGVSQCGPNDLSDLTFSDCVSPESNHPCVNQSEQVTVAFGCCPLADTLFGMGPPSCSSIGVRQGWYRLVPSVEGHRGSQWLAAAATQSENALRESLRFVMTAATPARDVLRRGP